MPEEKEENAMELLSAYIDGELQETEKNKVNSFLSGSSDGRKALERLKHTKTLLMSTPDVKVPEDFLDELELKAEKLMQKRSGGFFWRWSNPWAWAPSLALATALCVIGVGLRTPRQIPFEALLQAQETIPAGGGMHQKVVAASHWYPRAAVKNEAI